MFRQKIFFTSFVCLIITHCIYANNFAQQNLNTPQIIFPYQTLNYDAEINHIYQTVLNNQTDSVTTRIAKASAYFLGRPYLLGALGEGSYAEFDKNPLYRTDAFDCTTFVETTLALAEAKNLDQFKIIIKEIRYKNAVISFINRNHFMSVDWNVNNAKEGYIKDITDQFSTPSKTAIAIIDKPHWYQTLPLATIKIFQPISSTEAESLLHKLHANAEKVSPVESRIKYLPLTELFIDEQGTLVPNDKLFAQIPSGSIIEIVHPHADLIKGIGTRINVVHIGWAIRTTQGLMFREGSEYEGKVIDIPLVRYLAMLYRYDPTQGVNVQVILPRVTIHVVEGNA